MPVRGRKEEQRRQTSQTGEAERMRQAQQDGQVSDEALIEAAEEIGIDLPRKTAKHEQQHRRQQAERNQE